MGSDQSIDDRAMGKVPVMTGLTGMRMLLANDNHFG